MSQNNLEDIKTTEEHQFSPKSSKHDSPQKNRYYLPFNTLPRPQDGTVIRMRKPELIHGNLTSYVIYTIKGHDKNDVFEVKRRYSDFVKIRSIMVTRWPGCYIPPIPPKKMNNLEKQFVYERKRQLELFLQRMAEIPYLHYSEEYQIFIKSSRNDFDQEIQKYENVTYQNILERYNEHFGDISSKEVNCDTITKIADFRITLQKVLQHFTRSKEAAHKFALLRKNFYEKMSIFHKGVCVEYENKVFDEYHNHSESGRVFTNKGDLELNHDAPRIEYAAKRESIEHLDKWIDYEELEVEALLEAMAQRDKYENLKHKLQEKQREETNYLQQILAGNFSLASRLLGKPKEEEMATLEKQIVNTTQEIETLDQVHSIITLLLAEKEIEKFKGEKLKKYYQVIRTAAENELTNLNTVFGYWDAIGNNSNLKEEVEEKPIEPQSQESVS